MSKIRRTSPLTLTVVGAVGLVAGRVVRPIVESSGGSAPRVGWTPAVTLLLAGCVVGAIAWNTHQALHKRKQRMTSDHGVKLLALAKAAAIVGVLVAGVYAGYALSFVDAFDTPFGKERVLQSGGAAVASVVLMVAGLFLERACQIPGDGDDDTKGSGRRGHGTEASPA